MTTNGQPISEIQTLALEVRAGFAEVKASLAEIRLEVVGLRQDVRDLWTEHLGHTHHPEGNG